MVRILFHIFIASISLTCGCAFWWSSPTSTESSPILKQIPVGYFRTYTYQPLTYSSRYPPYTLPAANKFSYDSPALTWMQNSPQPAFVGPLKPQYSTPSTAPVAATTTPTPASTPQFRPLATQNYQPPSRDASRQQTSIPSIHAANIPSEVLAASPSASTYSQVNINPELSSYQYLSGPLSPQIQFVPCMCPVTVSIGGGKEVLENRGMVDSETLLQQSAEEDSSVLKD